jgi:DNA-binding MarR family transcriptional regulator
LKGFNVILKSLSEKDKKNGKGKGSVRMEQTLHMLLYRAFHAQRGELRPSLNRLGLGTGQPRILGYLVRNGAASQKELADYSEVDPSAISRMLESMQKGGFITRKASENDKRSGVVDITELGRKAYAEWRNDCDIVEERMLKGFNDEEKAELMSLLKRVYTNLKHTEKTEDEDCLKEIIEEGSRRIDERGGH